MKKFSIGNLFRQKICIGRISAVSLMLAFLVSTLLTGCSDVIKSAASQESIETSAAALPAKQAGSQYTITLDINPSIDLIVTDGLVTAANAYNDDGSVILQTARVIGLSQDAALDAIVKALKDASYFDSTEAEPKLIVTVANSLQAAELTAEALKASVEKVLTDNGVECSVNSTYVTDETVTAAAGLQISAGRYLLLDYIARTEGITIEEAIAKYGAAKIGELMDLYDGADKIFEVSGIDAMSASLTPEQKAALESALAAMKQKMQAAVDVFHQTFKTIKTDYKTRLEALRVQYKDSDKEMLHQEEALLKDSVLAARRAAIDARRQAFDAAKDEFLSAVAGLNLSKDALDTLAGDITDDMDVSDGDIEIDEDLQDTQNRQADDDRGNSNDNNSKNSHSTKSHGYDSEEGGSKAVD